MAKLSSTGKPLCSSCNRLATHRLAGYDRIEQKTFYAYQCDEHKHSTSEPIHHAIAVYHNYAACQHPLQMWRQLYRFIRLHQKVLWMNLSPDEQYANRFHPGVNQQEIAIFAADETLYCYPATVAGMREVVQALENEPIERKLCPFCAFFEQPARPIGTRKIGDVSACDMCSEGPDISEMLLDWLEEQS